MAWRLPCCGKSATEGVHSPSCDDAGARPPERVGGTTLLEQRRRSPSQLEADGVSKEPPRVLELPGASRLRRAQTSGPAQQPAPNSSPGPGLPRTCIAPRVLCRSSSLASKSATAPIKAESVLELSCDFLCIRTMHVSYLDRAGERRHCSQTGYSVKIFLPQPAADVEVTFSVVGGAAVHRVDRTQAGQPWVKDELGSFIPEKFTYHSPPEHVQFFIRGSSLHSFVAGVDERQRSESLLEMVSRDFACIRTMRVEYVDDAGERQLLTSSGYNIKFHLPSSARDVEVTFAVVGGLPVYKVDRRDPTLPWVQDANGLRPLESFCYESCPQCVQYEIRGYAWQAHISHVQEQAVRSSSLEEVPTHGSCGGLRPEEDGRELFDGAPDGVPGVGGIVDLHQPHSEFLLPAEVLLFEPTSAEIFQRSDPSRKGARLIFLNTPLSDAETESLAELRELLVRRGILAAASDPLPRYMQTHALRMLQTCKFQPAKVLDMMKVFVSERVRRLPIAEADVIDDLRTGFIYWHGRDRKCRPCLVFRLERLGHLARDKERAIRAVIFALEYALRFAMVPGRVENWVVLVDVQNIMASLSPLFLSTFISTAAAIGATLEKVYCGRMVWTKIVNMPGSSMIVKAINSVIPTEKKCKISFHADGAAALAEHFEPNQLERRFGGSAPDLDPDETYPFHFFPNPRGRAAYARAEAEEGSPMEPMAEASVESARSERRSLDEVEHFSMHEAAGIAFHEGLLWDESSCAARSRWLEQALASGLPPEAAEALKAKCGRKAVVCRTLSDWMALVNPKALNHECMARASCSDGAAIPERAPLQL